MTAPEWQTEAEVLGRFEPSPYDLGITDDPEATAGNEPVPYSLTLLAEAALDVPHEIGPYPGSGDPERLAQWCGFPSMASMEAACEADGRELAAESEADARWEAELEAEAEAAEDPEAEPW